MMLPKVPSCFLLFLNFLFRKLTLVFFILIDQGDEVVTKGVRRRLFHHFDEILKLILAFDVFRKAPFNHTPHSEFIAQEKLLKGKEMVVLARTTGVSLLGNL